MQPTKHTSRIPMTPDALPKQRLNEVVGLPKKPDDLNVLIQWTNGIGPKNTLKAHQESSPLYVVLNG